MAKLSARFRFFLEREALSVWLIVFSLAINVLAWLVPRDSYQHPGRDPLGLATRLSAIIQDGRLLYYFWHAVITMSLALSAYSFYKIWTLGLTRIIDRCDL